MFLSSDFVFVFGHCKGMNNSVCFKITFDVCPHVFRRFSLRLGFYSQAGNVLFPGWEYFIPKVGIIKQLLNGKKEAANYQGEALTLKQEASDNKIEQIFLKKVPIPPVNLSECLYIKDFRSFHPSLDLSRHLSHISPVSPHITPPHLSLFYFIRNWSIAYIYYI